MKNDDIFLLRLLREGDEKAFEMLFKEYFPSLCRFMHLYISETQIVEELTLDLFTYLWENRESVNIKVSMKAYLFQAAKNRCLNYLRNKEDAVSIEELEVEPQILIDSTLEVQELYELIQEAIMDLPDKCREVFVKSRWKNQTYQEIATEMNISVKTVEAQINKALKRIKAHLGDSFFYLF